MKNLIEKKISNWEKDRKEIFLKRQIEKDEIKKALQMQFIKDVTNFISELKELKSLLKDEKSEQPTKLDLS